MSQEDAVAREENVFEELVAGYKGGEEMPLAGYATLVGIYNAAFVAMLWQRRILVVIFRKKFR